MKKLILLLSILSIISCQKASHDYVEISGVFKNLETDTLLVYGNDRFKKKIPVKKDGSFKDTLTIKDGFYALSNGKYQAFMNLKKGYELHITADAKDFEKSISFKGDGAGTNNYLAEKIRIQKEFGLANLEGFFLLGKADFDTKVIKIEAFNNRLLEDAKDLDSTFIANEDTSNKRMIAFLKQNYTAQHLKLTTFAKGKPSPTFNLENYKGGKTALADLKGKYVYIDVWATWCAPCRQQIPALKKIEEDFKGKNIAFVSLSIDKQKDKAKWRKMIKNDKLSGIQLFAENAWESKFVKEYQISGIPRFILIDPNGNIVDANAPRPTDPRLLALFNSLNL